MTKPGHIKAIKTPRGWVDLGRPNGMSGRQWKRYYKAVQIGRPRLRRALRKAQGSV